ncbi:MAG: hypothetical protein JWN14_2837 [Chthonomonadales bacterium]|nr:hypothetical protein [Chthonomonadales bacterium]
MKESLLRLNSLLGVCCLMCGGGLITGCSNTGTGSMDYSSGGQSDDPGATQRALTDQRLHREADRNREERESGGSPPYPSNQYDTH